MSACTEKCLFAERELMLSIQTVIYSENTPIMLAVFLVQSDQEVWIEYKLVIFMWVLVKIE